MARPPHARDKVLDAFIELLDSLGERAATMEAIAARAGVSKGGLLYHFPSKEALGEALLARFRAQADVDIAEMASDPGGPSHHFVRTSWITESAIDTLYTATVRLAQSQWQPAIDALEAVQTAWFELIHGEVGDVHVAEAIMLIGEGLYHQASMPGTWSRRRFADNLDDLLLQVDRLKAGGSASAR
jgi:AcrR family transcriptional regulator